MNGSFLPNHLIPVALRAKIDMLFELFHYCYMSSRTQLMLRMLTKRRKCSILPKSQTCQSHCNETVIMFFLTYIKVLNKYAMCLSYVNLNFFGKCLGWSNAHSTKICRALNELSMIHMVTKIIFGAHYIFK